MKNTTSKLGIMRNFVSQVRGICQTYESILRAIGVKNIFFTTRDKKKMPITANFFFNWKPNRSQEKKIKVFLTQKIKLSFSK